jgi:hypothetical protein
VIFVQFNYKNHYCIFLKDSYNYCESVIVAKSLTADTLVLLYVINELRRVRSSYQKQNYSNWSHNSVITTIPARSIHYYCHQSLL